MRAHGMLNSRAIKQPQLVGRYSPRPPAAFPGWAQQLLGVLQPQQQQKQRQNPCSPIADELLQILTGDAPVKKQVDVLLDQLVAAGGLAFEEPLLGGGPWLVLYTRGSLQLWRATYSAGRLVNPSNAAGQDLDPDTRSVTNRAEYLGDKLWVTASGTYQPQDDRSVLPKRIQANIASGQLHAFGLNIPLPIRGTGFFEVVYLDDRLRVFRSGGAIAVQVKQQYLEELGLI